MSLSQLYSAIAGDTITAARWNNEFGNIYSNGTDVAFPVTKAVSFAGFTVTVDAGGVTTISSPSNAGFLFTVGAKSGAPSASGSLGSFTASTFTDSSTAAAGTAALWTGVSVRTPTLAASAATVTTTKAATVYIEGPPTAGSNQTLTGSYALLANGVIASQAGSDVASASAISIVAGFTTITGTTTIASITQQFAAGTTFRLMFTGTGLNITYNATSMITPWGVTYRTVANEILEFVSLGSGNYTFYSLNGPKEITGSIVEWTTDTIPNGGIECDGSAISRTTYAGLFAKISTTFGVGDASTTFNVPDRRGRVAIGVDGTGNRITASSVQGGNADTLGGAGGAETHSLITAELASHTHDVSYRNAGAIGAGVLVGTSSGAVNATATAAATATGSGTAHSNTQPWVAHRFYIRF